MNARTTGRKGFPHDVAAMTPDVEPRWRDEFLLELRLQEVPGDRIGDALMTVQTHVAESGESAEEAFGDPREYAREIAPSTGSGDLLQPSFVLGILVGLLGLVSATRALDGWLTDGTVRLRLGDAVSALVLVGLCALMLLAFNRAPRAMVAVPLWGVVLGMIGIGGLTVLPTLLLRRELAELSPLLVAATAVLLLAVSSLMAYRSTDEDEITAPGQEPSGGRSTRLFVALILPMCTLAALALTAIPALFR